MLVLSRKSQEAIQIGESITVTVLKVKGGQVRLAVSAPFSVRVLRAELRADLDLGDELQQPVGRQSDRPLAAPVPS